MKNPDFIISPELLKHLEERYAFNPEMLTMEEFERGRLYGIIQLITYLKSLTK